MKKFISIILVIILISSLFPIVPNANYLYNYTPESDFNFNPATGTITGYTGSGGEINIPPAIGGAAVKVIGDMK